MNFFSALYRIFIYDQEKGVLSHTKMWSNIGYACLCYTFVYAVMNGTTVDVMIWALFGVVVVGNRTVVQLFARSNTSPQNNRRFNSRAQYDPYDNYDTYEPRPPRAPYTPPDREES